jgi:circadian clock protein KaiC
MDRIASGNANLDRILCGGFPANAIHIVMGNPGTGKTILAEHLAFENATSSRPALYLTTFSEPLPKFLSFLQEYSFADPSRIGTEVFYDNLGETLEHHPERLSQRVEDLLQQHRPKVLVIDSFKAIADVMPDTVTWRRELYHLAGLLSAYSVTSLWVGEYTAEMVARLPEFAVADGIVELTRVQRGARDFRFLRVVKLRGSGFLNGFHAVQLTRAGLKVYPRLVTPVVPIDYHPIDERLSSGVEGLDAMIETGWLRGTSTLVRGPSGAGKTILCLQFLMEGVRGREPCLFVNFEENPVQLARVMKHMGWDPAALLERGRLDVFYTSPVELQIDTILGELFERIREQGIRRLAFDGLADLAVTADDPLRIRDYLFALTQQLATERITSMFTIQESTSGHNIDLPEVSYLGDNVVHLEVKLGDELERTIRILKSRGSAHDGRRHSLVIRRGGIVVT